ncbi:MAG: hypothetical protein VKP62_00125 [Candidatus Sericytochromatia bacterium]|nr:hypothetical protein [Candidatus Sericytochromatia bacterium]
MDVGAITIERKTDLGHCGTVAFRIGSRAGFVLFIATCQSQGRMTIEFLPGLAAHHADIAAHHDALSDAVARHLFDNLSRKSLFARRASDAGIYLPPMGPSPEGWYER